ncbi:hypothetical protein COO91_07164 [Nostoc flagelliforme CCNUN1]|uniref:Uncharacterized protein n=1 Tax=Nostoc flagelliforme CCNUN1 TaxID=2038116 RepID=A0A2K8T0C0_9NOSO|nr:hypothetical protein COO91_07164 [Nostoc flagelliforme CCNUN1]
MNSVGMGQAIVLGAVQLAAVGIAANKVERLCNGLSLF